MPEPVLVVGAGPAGSAAAWKMASSGTKCILLDRNGFPRDKVCGGILSGRAVRHLTDSGLLTTEEIEGLTLAEHRDISFWSRGDLLRKYTSSQGTVRIVSRLQLDQALLQKAVSAGAEFSSGERVVEVAPDSVTTSVGSRFRFRDIVAADGCGSIVRRKLLGPSGKGRGLGLQCIIPRSHDWDPPDGLEIHFGHLPYGYIWVFPDSEKTCIGAGAVGSRAGATEIRTALEAFMEARGLAGFSFGLRGAPIPSLSLHRSMGSGNVFLAGDAAGLVDQVSGEGIGFAIESGLLVADCICGITDRWEMVRRASAGCAGTVRQSSFYRHLLFGRLFFSTAMDKLRESEGFARGYWEIISGSASYNSMFASRLGF